MLTRDYKLSPMTLNGSYAGALGIPQFMPSNYRQYAVSYDGKSSVNLLEDHDDAIASIAYYLQRSGWVAHQPVTVPAKISGKVHPWLLSKDAKPTYSLKTLAKFGVHSKVAESPQRKSALIVMHNTHDKEYWLTFPNFYAIMAYNPRTRMPWPFINSVRRSKKLWTRKSLRQAQQFQQQGDLVQALAVYLQLLAENPGNADLLHQIGILYAQQQDYVHSLDYLNQALIQQPRSAAVHNSKGNVFLRQGNPEAALAEYQRAVKSDPRYAIAYNNMGRCLYLQEKFIAAQKAYAKALELNPNFGDAYYNQGVLMLKIGKLAEAHVSLERALTLNPKNAAIHGQMAQIYLQKGEYPEAIDYLQKRLIAQPDHIDSWHYLGMAHFSLNQFEDAVHCFEKVLQLTHRHPECYEHLAIAYLKLDDKEKALTYFFRQLEIQPTANAYYNIGVLLIEKGRHRDAIEYLRQAVALEPLHLPAHLNLGVLYLKSQQQEDALTHYQQAAAIKPDDPEIQHILMALTQNKVPDKAPAEYLKNLFDQYADYYDKHLTESLRYRVPQQLHAAISQLTSGMNSRDGIF